MGEPEDLNFSLRGTGVHVYKEGRLYVKCGILPTRRACIADVRGQVLTISQGDQRKSRQYNLFNATLHSNRSHKRLVIHFANREKLNLYAENQSDFDDWTLAFSHSIDWNISLFYTVGTELGRGAYAVVKKGVHKDTGDVVAIKVISKASCSEEDLKYVQREVDIAQSLKHTNIVGTLDLFESNKEVFIVLEYMQGGTLQGVVDTIGPLPEEEAGRIMLDLLSALQYIHQLGIVHRDIKPENLMCTASKPPLTLKVMDFGLSRVIQGAKFGMHCASDDDSLGPDGLMTTPVGTPCFTAPEIIMNLPYGKEVDMFACGVVMYWLLCGYLPFEGKDSEVVVEKIKANEFDFPKRDWDKVSKSAKDLIGKLLDSSPYMRISADEALLHPWITENSKSKVVQRDPGVTDSVKLDPNDT